MNETILDYSTTPARQITLSERDRHILYSPAKAGDSELLELVVRLTGMPLRDVCVTALQNSGTPLVNCNAAAAHIMQLRHTPPSPDGQLYKYLISDVRKALEGMLAEKAQNIREQETRRPPFTLA